MRLASLLYFGLTILAACDYAVSGGIVDNGHHPKPSPEPKNSEDARPEQTRDEGRDGGALADVQILEKFSVDAPAGWIGEDQAAASGTMTLRNGDQQIVFAYGTAPCEGFGTTNEHGMTILPCSPTQTALLDQDDVVVANHSVRTPDIDQILSSFRRVAR